ncbi:fructuronate reductase [Arcanobacterium pluranimalium]|uniref:mannitol dehydrogenase family protein n=1 Tax=Arcanobacterium pluranimalium TaxID=108028 RepID=UPI001958867E|nr:mannitol dehydrogenase family protein [Arcanobacterium pluranimalium]MBM7825043.1 fructuronate reductase [Arcanobacterium pluranimalium]
MQLNLENLDSLAQLAPQFDVEQMQAQGKENPRWIHIGPGNIFRIFIARIAHDLIAAGHEWPVTAVIPMDPVELDVQLAKHDLMTLGVTLNPDGERDIKVIAGMCEGLATRRREDFERLVEIIRSESVSLMSFTITEKGYAIHDAQGLLQTAVEEEIASDPFGYHAHTMALVAGLLWHRFNAGGAPITLLSTDNFSHNGDKLRESVLTIARGWAQAGTVPEQFITWLGDEANVAFPISVIDKITPRPNDSIAAELAQIGFTDMAVETPNRAPYAGFVNAEPTEYLIIEDKFAGERPPFEDFGVSIVDRKVCDDFENMKVTTCLNPLHTALAVAGCLLRFPTIDSEMRDEALAALVNQLGWNEGLPVVVDPGIVKPEDFLREVLEVRFPNRYLPDDPARIAMDTSQKIPIRFGETIKKYIERGMDLDSLHAMPLVFALWCRYLMAVADDGEELTLSPDPLLEELQAHVAHIRLGEETDVHAALEPILSNKQIFGVDLYDTPLATKVEKLFAELISAPGAVRATLDKEMNTK